MEAIGTAPIFKPLPDLAAAAPPGFVLPRRPRIEGAPEHFDRGVDQFQSGGGGGGAASNPLPFDITLAAGVATFRPGLVNGFVPTNYASGLAVSMVGTVYINLVVTTSSGKVTNAYFEAAGSPAAVIGAAQGAPPTTFKVLIHIVTSGSAERAWGLGNVVAEPSEAFRLEKVSPTPGTPPYDIYYTWNLLAA